MDLTLLQKSIHQNNQAKGFWNERMSVPAKMREMGFDAVEIDFVERTIRDQMLLLIISEISEAMEAARSNKRADLTAFYSSNQNNTYAFTIAFEAHIKDTHEDEIADAIIRLLDYAKGMGIDLEQHIQLKLHYNTTRPYKHGKNS